MKYSVKNFCTSITAIASLGACSSINQQANRKIASTESIMWPDQIGADCASDPYRQATIDPRGGPFFDVIQTLALNQPRCRGRTISRLWVWVAPTRGELDIIVNGREGNQDLSPSSNAGPLISLSFGSPDNFGGPIIIDSPGNNIPPPPSPFEGQLGIGLINLQIALRNPSIRAVKVGVDLAGSHEAFIPPPPPVACGHGSDFDVDKIGYKKSSEKSWFFGPGCGEFSSVTVTARGANCDLDKLSLNFTNGTSKDFSKDIGKDNDKKFDFNRSSINKVTMKYSNPTREADCGFKAKLNR